MTDQICLNQLAGYLAQQQELTSSLWNVSHTENRLDFLLIWSKRDIHQQIRTKVKFGILILISKTTYIFRKHMCWVALVGIQYSRCGLHNQYHKDDTSSPSCTARRRFARQLLAEICFGRSVVTRLRSCLGVWPAVCLLKFSVLTTASAQIEILWPNIVPYIRYIYIAFKIANICDHTFYTLLLPILSLMVEFWSDFPSMVGIRIFSTETLCEQFHHEFCNVYGKISMQRYINLVQYAAPHPMFSSSAYYGSHKLQNGSQTVFAVLLSNLWR